MSLGDFLFPHAELKLAIVRSFNVDTEAAKGIPSQAYADEAAIVRLNNNDVRRLGMKGGSNVVLKSPCGEVVVKVAIDDKIPEGSAAMPYGPWALALVAIPKGSSPPVLHGLVVNATRSDEGVTSIETLLHP